MKLLYYLIALGDPSLKEKHEILLSNLKTIYNNINQKFSININFYDDSEEIKESIKNLDFIENTYYYNQKGVLTELFLTNPNNKYIEEYDYVLLMLDDVYINEIDINHMIQVKNKYNIDILSPKIINGTHSFMNCSDYLTINNSLEVYCLFLDPVGFNKFCSIHTLENKWMWGVDFLFGFYKIKTGVINKYSATHKLPSKSNRNDALEMMRIYISKHTPYKGLWDINNHYEPIIEMIKEY